MNIKSASVLIAMIAAAVPVSGQDMNQVVPGQQDDDNEAVRLRVIHAVPNAPAVSISVGGQQLFKDIAAMQISGFKVMPTMDNQQVVIKLADGRVLKTTEEFDFDNDDNVYTVLIAPDESGPNPKVVVLEDDDDAGEVDMGDDAVEITVINASPQHKAIKVQLDDNEIESGLNYSEAGDDDVEVGNYSLKVMDTDGVNTIIATKPVSLTIAGSYTVLVTGQNEVRVVNNMSPTQDLAGGAAGAGMATGTTTGTASGSMMTRPSAMNTTSSM